MSKVMKKVKSITTFKKGQQVPKEFLQFYHDNALVDLGAVFMCSGTVVVCECGFIVFIYGKDQSDLMILIDDRSNEGFANSGFAEILYLCDSIKIAEKEHDIESIYGCGVKPYSVSQLKRGPKCLK